MEFIESVVAEVINRLSEFGLLNKSMLQSESENQEFAFEKKLLSAEEAKKIIKTGNKKLFVLKETIITPLAKDMFAEEKIKIKYGVQEINCCENNLIGVPRSNKIALIANKENEAYKIKTVRILKELGKEVECIKPKTATFSNFNKDVEDIASEIKNDKYDSAIIISANTFQIMKSIEHMGDLNSKICWEIEEDKKCTERSKLLFVNSNLIGFKKLKEKISTWLDMNKTAESFNGVE